MEEETPAQPSPDSQPTPQRRGRGRRLMTDSQPRTDTANCVMHHVRIHETLDAIVRSIVTKRGISFREASEEALLAWANANGVKVEAREVAIVRPDTETRFEVAG